MPSEAQTEERKPIYGIDPENADAIADAFGALPTDVEELPEGGMADIRATIVGFGFQEGGETKPSQDDPTETFVTSDTLILHLRVDDWEEQGLENSHTVQFLRLPKMLPNGTRAKPTKNSAYGIWMGAWDGLGISSDPEKAFVLQIGSVGDLLGIMIHRKRETFEFGQGGRTFNVDCPVEIIGVDKKVRKDAGLSPMELKLTG